MIKKERSKYVVRFHLNDIIDKYKLEDVFVNFLNLFIEEKFNIKLILYFGEAGKGAKMAYEFERKYKEVLDKLNYALDCRDTEFAWYDIFHESLVDERQSYKFRNVYSNEDEFVQAVFTFITFMKGIKNKEEEKKNEGGYSRKQNVRKKTTYKESNMGTKEKI